MGCALPHTYFNEAPCPPFTSHGAPIMLVVWTPWLCVRVRVEIMGSPTCRIVGKSQPVLAVIHPIVFTRTRIGSPCLGVCTHCDPISIPLSSPAPVIHMAGRSRQSQQQVVCCDAKAPPDDPSAVVIESPCLKLPRHGDSIITRCARRGGRLHHGLRVEMQCLALGTVSLTPHTYFNDAPCPPFVSHGATIR
eukprot:COSAG01_NODE_2732_length_7167_cov_174.607951_5_plen_192_part_00